MDWLDVVHLLDSSFPTGAYTHSFGLESLAPTNLEHALRLRLDESIARLDLVFLLNAYTRDLLELDQLMHACLLVREPREASSRIGTSLLRAACDILADTRLEHFLGAGEHHHHAVVFGAVASTIDLTPQQAAEAYAFSSLRALSTAAQRLGWIGQREVQRILHHLKPAVYAAVTHAARVPLDEAGSFAPMWDLASMRHEVAPARMFAS
jgi:urease accessory protein